jgi:hypothetical protein
MYYKSETYKLYLKQKPADKFLKLSLNASETKCLQMTAFGHLKTLYRLKSLYCVN